MEYIYLVVFKILACIKMIAVKNCGTIAKGPKNSLKINLLRTSVSVIIGLIVWLIAKRDFPDRSGLIFALVGGVSIAINLFTWILCSEHVSLCVVEVFAMIGSVVVTLMVSPLLYEGESVSLLQWAGCVLLIVAAFLFSNKKEKSKFNIATVTLLLLCLLSSAGSSIGKKLYKTYAIGSDESYTLISFVCVGLVLGLLYLFFSVKGNKNEDVDVQNGTTVFLNKRILVLIAIASATLYASEFFFVKASIIPSGILYPLSYGLGMTLTFLIDVILYKEKPTVSSITALILTIGSIILTVG